MKIVKNKYNYKNFFIIIIIYIKISDYIKKNY